MNKKLLTLLFLLISCMTAFAQSNAITTSEDSTINVIAWFSKNDTTEYKYSKTEMTISGKDTTRTSGVEQEFRVVVLDSTSNGYRLQYEPLSFKADNEKDSLKSCLLLSMQGEEPAVFTTDEYGEIKHLENWRKVREEALPLLTMYIEALYKKTPALDSIMPKRNFMSLIRLGFTSEDEVKKLFTAMTTMFELHGNSFKIGITQKDDQENELGYPVKASTLVTYEDADTTETDSDEGDYLIRNSGSVLFPASDVKNLASSMVGLFLTDSLANTADSLIADSLGVPLELRILTDYHYFYSGWPKLIRKQTIAKLGDIVTKVTTETIEWKHYHWNVFARKEDDKKDTIGL